MKNIKYFILGLLLISVSSFAQYNHSGGIGRNEVNYDIATYLTYNADRTCEFNIKLNIKSPEKDYVLINVKDLIPMIDDFARHVEESGAELNFSVNTENNSIIYNIILDGNNINDCIQGYEFLRNLDKSMER
jgi:hypothetical protein